MAGRRMWEPDGAGWRAQIGVLTPDNDAVPESEFWTLAPERVSVHAARVPLVDVLTYHQPPGPDTATARLAGLPLRSIVFAFTTTSYLLGTTGEQEDLGRPVLTANQVAFWYALRLAGVGAEVGGHGQVFKATPVRKYEAPQV